MTRKHDPTADDYPDVANPHRPASGSTVGPSTNRRTVLKSTAALLTGGALASGTASADHYDSSIHYEPEVDEDGLMELVVEDHEVLEDGLRLDLGSHEGYIRLFADDLARVSVVEPGEEEYESRGIANGLDAWDAPSFSVDETDETLSIDTETITVEVNKDLFGVTFLDEDGTVINEDYLENGSAGYEDGKPYAYKKTDEDEAFYGFGEQPGLDIDKRGETLENWNTDQFGFTPDNDYMYTSVPFFVGLKDAGAYGIFFDDPYHSVFEMATDSEDYYSFLANGGQLTYYFAYGPDIGAVLDRYTDLTGTIDLPPKWGIGFHQSRFRYSPEELVETPQRYREEEIPLDAMHFDIQYMDDFRVYTWEDEYRDAIETLTDEMPELKTVGVNNPGVAVVEEVDGEPYGPYLEGEANDYWVKNADGDPFVGEIWPPEAVWADFSREEVREWWARKHDALFDAGIDGIKNDMAEPAVFNTNNPKYDLTMPVDNVHGTGADTMLHEEYHNLYGFDMARAAQASFDHYRPDERPFTLNRNLYAGGQRYAALWTGDNVSTWLHLRQSLPILMNLGLSGLPFVGSDVGGFSARPTPELFKRWTELGAFYPYSRNHAIDHLFVGEDQPRNQHPWTYGEEGIEITKKYTELRYQLMPYLYNEFEESSENGKPVFQPLVYQYQDDPEVRNISDEFLFGDDVLITPVVEQGAIERDVYFPAGDRWVDFWTNEIHEGGQWKTVDAPIDHLPIYVRKDSIVPMREVQQYTGEKPLPTLELRTYLDDEASYSFYEDDGETRAFQDGEYNVTHFTVSANNGGVVTFERELGVQNYEDSELSSYLLNLDRSEAPRKVQAASSKYEKVDADDVEDVPESFAYSAEEDTVLVHIPADEDRKVQLFFNGDSERGRGRGNQN
ncbi:glycoside hydrolase family 31 protein [Haloarcula amylovorans]|uniref:glycoside hydrolase family 31 protein n=1 Tax=Haloarcula amylovorans TaxID=2562280 RepID=UPI0010760661|nr:glycoside hydrolase family 31 protein [Halomicroarcula amylolytica]